MHTAIGEGELDMKLTAAQRRALVAVRDGKVRRQYTRMGNVFKPPEDVGAAVLWRLEALHLICDAKSNGRFSEWCDVELTTEGEKLCTQQ